MMDSVDRGSDSDLRSEDRDAGISGLNESDKEAGRLYDRIASAVSNPKEAVLGWVDDLRRRSGLNTALRALYRQQVRCGFILSDPRSISRKDEKRIFDPDTGITFRLQWNPDRELRRDHGLLAARGIIDASVDPKRLINKDARGKPCYLDKHNIELQNPKEVLVPVALGGEDFFVGANFASITDNHFTVMNAEHRPQAYRETIPRAMNDFLDATEGAFRIVFNGLAGASIKEHEHFQVTTEPFPVEEIRVLPEHLISDRDNVRILMPVYETPVCIVEGPDRGLVERRTDGIITAWERESKGEPTVNILAVRREDVYRMFVFFRDRRRQVGPGKEGVMATFEAGGFLVMSFRPEPGESRVDELTTFRNAKLDTVKRMLRGIAPEAGSLPLILDILRREDRS